MFIIIFQREEHHKEGEIGNVISKVCFIITDVYCFMSEYVFQHN